MENKLTWVELKKVVAQQTNLTEKEVNQILNIWLEVMTTALKNGEDLHINGLGTFRIKTMKERKSVNVTTGEAIVLPETNRLTYTMAAGLEDQLKDNAPSKMEIGIDPICKLSEQADEIVGILGELGQSPNKEDKAEATQTTDQSREPEEPKATLESPIQPQIKKKKNRRWLVVGITTLALIALMVGAFLLFQNRMAWWMTGLHYKTTVVSKPVPAKQTKPIQEVCTEPMASVEETIEENNEVQLPDRRYTEFIAVENMHKDSRLTWMAYRYYGNKQLWVFIYDANKDHLENPEIIAIGTPIRVPKLDESIIQLNSPELQALVQQMADEFLRK